MGCAHKKCAHTCFKIKSITRTNMIFFSNSNRSHAESKCVYQYALLLLLCIFMGNVSAQQVSKPIDVFQVNALLGRGINIEGAENVKASHYAAIKAAGFSNVRIPIHPFKEIISNEDFTLKPSF